MGCEMKTGAEVTKEPREEVLHKGFGRALPSNSSWFVVFLKGAFVIEAVQTGVSKPNFA